MTIDERLDRLTERHEALTQSVELLLASSREDRQAIQGLFAGSRENRQSIEGLIATAKADGENIRALARIAEIHERRITGLEGGDDSGI